MCQGRKNLHRSLYNEKDQSGLQRVETMKNISWFCAYIKY